MTDRERELLSALARYDAFKSIAVLQYYHPELKGYTKHQLLTSAAVLVRDGLAARTVGRPHRETKYRITDEGRKRLPS